MTTELSECLCYDPFEGDESEVVTMSDKIVRANKDHPHCNICHGAIAKGERHRAINQVNRELGTRMTFRFCSACCIAMIALDDWGNEDEGPDAKLIERHRLGDARRFQETAP